MLSGIARFLVEFIRRNPKVLWNLSNAQLASAGCVFVGLVLVVWASAHPATGPEKAIAAAEKVA
jgi:phosphatidylglycerol:prolipoprotein diacylglycerol transferase